MSHLTHKVEPSSESESDDKMDSDEFKQVSFSEDVEVRVFNSLPVTGPKILKGMKTDGIKSRLGKNSGQLSSLKSLHNVKKVSMKPEKFSSTGTVKVSKMKSDNMTLQSSNVHSRLDMKNSKSTMQLTDRIKNFKLDASIVKSKSSSVFNRLGANKN